MFKLLGVLLLSISMQAQNTWLKVANQDQTVTSTTAITYRFGVPYNTPVITGATTLPCQTTTGCWTTPVVTAGAASVFANPARLGNPILNTLKELDILESAVPQTVTVTDVKGTNLVVNIPADPGLVLPPLLGCPTGSYAEIAGKPGVIATIPIGTIYTFEWTPQTGPTHCKTATQLTPENMAQGNIVILNTTSQQMITMLKTDGNTDFVQIDALAGSVSTPPKTIYPSSVNVVLEGKTYLCSVVSGILTCVTQ